MEIGGGGGRRGGSVANLNRVDDFLVVGLGKLFEVVFREHVGEVC